MQAGRREEGDTGFQQESLEFQRRISFKNGLSDCTYFPPALHQDPPHADLDAARIEAKMVLFGAIQEVLDRTGSPLPKILNHTPFLGIQYLR